MKPRILLIDIETAPHRAYVWGLRGQDIATNQIVEPGYTLCWAAKWLGDREVYFQRVSGGLGSAEYEDTSQLMIGAAHRLIEEADAVVHYNGAKFDIPTLQKEFLEQGMQPASPVKQIDLYRVVRKQFRFPSYKLDYVARALGIGGKVKHMGMELWRRCMGGDEAAWKTMRRYNIRDVRITESLYDRLLPWVQPHLNHGLFAEGDRPVCPNCGSSRVIARGTARTITQVYPRYQCKPCGKWMRGRKTLGAPDATMVGI